MEACNCHKTKERSEEEYKRLINRLSRVEAVSYTHLRAHETF